MHDDARGGKTEFSDEDLVHAGHVQVEQPRQTLQQVVLLVSLSTQVSDLLTAIEDLQSVDAHEVGVVVLTRVPSRRRW